MGSSPRARGTPTFAPLTVPPPRFIPASAGNTGRCARGCGSAAVHPRERGEHAKHRHRGLDFIGSSPRARGTRVGPAGQPQRGRFIPASAGNTRILGISTAAAAVHPRERGEHIRRSACQYSARGSSPRARGTRSIADPQGGSNRFIPASAGNTPGWPDTSTPCAVHPRERGEHVDSRPATGSCHRFIPASAGNTRLGAAPAAAVTVHPRERGEHRDLSSNSVNRDGSSPRARGTHHHPLRPGLPRRFIPASAGNTPPWSSARPPGAVHPRERGEHSRFAVSQRSTRGSSPRARGTRSTPAPPRSRGTVHPRERGEHAIPCWMPTWNGGSSPRARGTPSARPEPGGDRRFIPASAGNTRIARRAGSRAAVHPRERGEHSREAGTMAKIDGSSPRARGTQPEAVDDLVSERFIPASAGNTPAASTWASRSAVHPRERGEHLKGTTSDEDRIGSSPRARGTLHSRPVVVSLVRFIPASAGNTCSGVSQSSASRGSSPRARGTRQRRLDAAAHDRFIPASAGNTPWPGARRPAAPVHPRERGEHA